MKSKSLKISSTAYRVMLILYLLNKDTNTLDELIEKLSNDAIVSRTFSKDVILKYINTLRYSGFEITRLRSQVIHIYQLKKAPILLNLTYDELKTAALVSNYVEELYQSNLSSFFNKAMEKISRFLTEEDLNIYNNHKQDSKLDLKNIYKNYALLIELLEQYCIDKQTIQILYSSNDKQKQKITLEPECIEYKGKKVYIYGTNPVICHKQYIQLDYIKSIKQLPSKLRNINVDYQVTFKLSGKLAKSYRLYEKETIIEYKNIPPSIIVSATVSDINSVLLRLMRYGHYCEVLSPAHARNKMSEIINNLIKSYTI